MQSSEQSRIELIKELESAKQESDILNASIAAPIQMPPENIAEFPVVFERSNDGMSSKPPSNRQQSQFLEVPFPITTEEIKSEPSDSKLEVKDNQVLASGELASKRVADLLCLDMLTVFGLGDPPPSSVIRNWQRLHARLSFFSLDCRKILM